MSKETTIDSKLHSILDTNKLSITQSDQHFQKNPDVNLRNPSLMHEEIANKKSAFKKLKFLYLEQETTHLFLKEVLDVNNKLFTNDKSVFDEEYNSLRSEASERKESLQQIKGNLESKIEDLVSLTNETDLLLQNFEDRSRHVKELFNEFDELEKKLDKYTEIS